MFFRCCFASAVGDTQPVRLNGSTTGAALRAKWVHTARLNERPGRFHEAMIYTVNYAPETVGIGDIRVNGRVVGPHGARGARRGCAAVLSRLEGFR